MGREFPGTSQATIKLLFSTLLCPGMAGAGRSPYNPAAPSLKQIYSFAKRGRLYAADPFSEVCATRRPLVGAKTCEAWNSEVTGGSVTEANLALLRGDRAAPSTPSAALPGTSQATGGSLQASIGGAPGPGRIQLFQRNGVAKMEWVPRRPLGRAFSSKFFPKQWLHWRGSYGKGKGRGSIRVRSVCRRFRLRRNAVLRLYIDFDCAGSHKVAVPILAISKASFYRVFVHVFGHERHFAWQVQGIRHLWRSETWVYVGRCKESDTLWNSWQAQYFVDVAKTLAGVCHSKDCVLRGRCRESAPWILYFEVKGLNSWEGLHFWNLSLGMLLRGQCSISYDLGSWFRGRRNVSEARFRNVNPLRRSCVSSARNAGEIAFLDFEVQPSAEIVRVECAECRWNCDFGFRSATLCGDRACRVRGMQVKLRFRIAKCNPLRRSCVSSARNAGEIAISDCEVQPSAEIKRVHRAKCW